MPQVVWANGVLASTAVEIFIDLVTGWTNQKEKKFYLAYDGNTGKIIDHIRLRSAPEECDHYPFNQIGPPVFTKL